MSRKKLQVPLNFKTEPPILESLGLQNTNITQQEFEAFWNSLKLHIQHSESQIRWINIVNIAITVIFGGVLAVSAFGMIGHPVIIAALLLSHISVYMLLLHLSIKQNLKKRAVFLERENKRLWKARGLRWSIEKETVKSLEETLVLSEDNEIALNLDDSGINNLTSR